MADLLTSVPGTGRLLRDDEKSISSPVPSSYISRPGSQSTVKDGVVMRWEVEQNSMLRRPRTTGVFVHKTSAGINKKRFGMMINKKRTEGLVKHLTAAAAEYTEQKTAAELSYDSVTDPLNPNLEHKAQLMKQYHLWNGHDLKKMELPPLPQGPQHKSMNTLMRLNGSIPRQVLKPGTKPKLTMTLPPISLCTTQSSNIYTKVTNPGVRRRQNSNPFTSLERHQQRSGTSTFTR